MELIQSQAGVMKHMKSRDPETNSYVISTAELEKTLKRKIEYERVLLNSTIDAYEKELDHRERIARRESLNALSVAIIPDEVPAIRHSQDILNWDSDDGDDNDDAFSSSSAKKQRSK